MKTLVAILAATLSIGSASAQYPIGQAPVYSPPVTGTVSPYPLRVR